MLDLDATDIPLYGHQPERFFHGYYDSYCYLPLYIFAGDQLLCARLRPANQDAAAGTVEEVSRIVAQLRQRWPKVKIVLRADSGFCREELMGWCEHNHVDYVFGLARNQRLAKIIGAQMHQARVLHQSTGKAARVFTEFDYRTRKSWSCSRRVVAKAEYLDKGENPRFVVTSLTAEEWAAQDLYEKFYCARGEMENRIKEQMCLFADRLSTDEMTGNQLRLYFSALAYTLMEALRRLALKGTAWAQAQVDTIRLKLFKIGAIVSISVRRVAAPDQLGLSRGKTSTRMPSTPCAVDGAHRSEKPTFHLHRDRRPAEPCAKASTETKPKHRTAPKTSPGTIAAANKQPPPSTQSTQKPPQGGACEICGLGDAGLKGREQRKLRNDGLRTDH